MNVFQLITLGAALFNLFLALFVFLRDVRSKTHLAYLAWGVSIAIWNFGTYFLFRVEDPEKALFWARFLHFGVIFLPVTLLHLALLVAQIRVGKFIFVFYAVQVLFALCNLTGWFIADVRNAGYAWYSVAGPVYWPFLGLYGLSSMATLVVLYRRQLNVSPLLRVRLKSLMLAAGILIFFGLNDIAPILGVDRYPWTEAEIYPLASLAAIFYSLIIGYSVLQHHLLDVHVTLGRLAAYLVRLTLMFLVGFALMLVVAVVFPSEFTPLSFGSTLAVILISAVVASFFFPRLFGQGDDTIERKILGDRFEYHDKIQGFIQTIPWHSDANELMAELDGLLVRTVQVESYSVALLDENTRRFAVAHSYPKSSASRELELEPGSPVFSLFLQKGADYLGVGANLAIPGEPDAATGARGQLAAFGAQYSFPFMSNEELFGLLFLGPKHNGEPYTPHDLHLLTLLCKNLSAAMNQIRLKEQVALAQEMELLGRMSRGLAHDLNNLLTPISTLTQLLQSDVSQAADHRELLSAADENVQTIQSYIREALFFSQTREPHFEMGRLDRVIEKVVQIAESSLNRHGNNVTIGELPAVEIEMDAVMIQRMLGNLLSNAIDASSPGTGIRVEVHPLARTDTHRDWYRLLIVDSGEGISQTNMKRIFTPFFTTKDRGDETRGFGLGLAVCRKIVHLHGGSLQLTSVETRGTTVQVDLPSRQMRTVKEEVPVEA